MKVRHSASTLRVHRKWREVEGDLCCVECGAAAVATELSSAAWNPSLLSHPTHLLVISPTSQHILPMSRLLPVDHARGKEPFEILSIAPLIDNLIRGDRAMADPFE